MIFGHEGLPRSGKSLESMTHVCDSLNAGRVVVTNIAGISHAAISKYLSIPLPTVERLLICLEPPEDIARDEEKVIPWVKQAFLDNAKNDCLFIWDEINQFWPPDRQALPPVWAKFVTEHGHKGIDILIMGQDLSELHQTWRKRLERYTRFTKLTMMGKEGSYHWASYANNGRLRFKKTADGTRPYNEAFFGFYKSHEDGTNNKGNYKDGRFAIFQKKHKFFALLFFIALFAAGYNVWGFFHPELDEPVSSPKKESQPFSATPEIMRSSPASSGVPQVSDIVTRSAEPIDYFDGFAIRYQMRLSGVIDRVSPGVGQAAFEFTLDFLDEAYRVKERMSRSDVSSLGWSIERLPHGLRIYKDDREYTARAWPLDNFGKASNSQIAALRPQP